MVKLAKNKSSIFRIFGKLEKEIMEIVWDKGTVTVRDVYEAIKKNRKVAYTTVMTIMDRLFSKKVLDRKKQGKTYLYTASSSKADFFKKTSRRIISDLMADFGDVALAQFVNTLDRIDQKKLNLLKKKIKESK